jgi:hypothetical protein
MLPDGGHFKGWIFPVASLLGRNSTASKHVLQRVTRLQFVELDALFEALERRRTA